MTLADSNVWLALAVEEHQHHAVIAAWLAEQTSIDAIAFCRATQTSFLRLLTTKSVMNGYGSRPLTNVEAWGVYEGLLADSRATYLEEPFNLDLRWKSFAVRRTVSPKLWMDAYLAAFAITSGCAFVTFDAAFQQFDGLDLHLLSLI